MRFDPLNAAALESAARKEKAKELLGKLEPQRGRMNPASRKFVSEMIERLYGTDGGGFCTSAQLAWLSNLYDKLVLGKARPKRCGFGRR